MLSSCSCIRPSNPANTHTLILGWPKNLFGFFHKVLRKPNFFCQTNTYVFFCMCYFPVNKVWVCVRGGGGREIPNLSPNLTEAKESNHEALTSQAGKTEKAGNGQCWQDTPLRCWQVYKKVRPFGRAIWEYLSRLKCSLPVTQRFCFQTHLLQADLFSSLANFLALRSGCPSVNPTPGRRSFGPTSLAALC